MISEIKFRDEHKVLRGLHLSFTKDDGTAYKTVILAGENGCGKTTILQVLDGFANKFIKQELPGYRTLAIEAIKFIGFFTKNTEERLNKSPEYSRISERVILSPDTPNNFVLKVCAVRQNHEEEGEARWIDCKYICKNYITTCSFIETRVQFSYSFAHPTNEKQSNIDDDSMRKLTNICLRDQNILARKFFELQLNKEGAEENKVFVKYVSEVKQLPICTFKEAFSYFLRDKQLEFIGLKNENQNQYELSFKKNNDNEFSINNLSSGEKQIVFRGTYILSLNNKNKLTESKGDTIVLVDEPELSMHPKWQKRILKYYQDLLSVDKVDENGNPIKNEKGEKEKEQTEQLIVATHSPYIIEAAMTGKNKDDTLIIILKEKDGKIEPTYVYSTDNGFCVKKDRAEENDAPENDDFIFNDSPTPAEVNYIVFGILSVDYHQELYAYLQSLQDKDQVGSCDEFINGHEIYKKSGCKYEPKCFTDSGGKKHNNQTLPTYIRNAIDHPYYKDENGKKTKKEYTEYELRTSIKLLREIIKDEKLKKQTES